MIMEMHLKTSIRNCLVVTLTEAPGQGHLRRKTSKGIIRPIILTIIYPALLILFPLSIYPTIVSMNPMAHALIIFKLVVLQANLTSKLFNNRKGKDIYIYIYIYTRLCSDTLSNLFFGRVPKCAYRHKTDRV